MKTTSSPAILVAALCFQSGAAEQEITYRSNAEYEWIVTHRMELSEEALIDGLKLDWNAQRQQIQEQLDAMREDVKAGKLSKEEYKAYI